MGLDDLIEGARERRLQSFVRGNLEVDSTNITYECGCVNRIHPSGVLQSLSKCQAHRAEGGKKGLQYYIDMGCIVGDRPASAKYEAELLEPLERMGVNLEIVDGTARPCRALDIGSGVSQYAALFMRLGYIYFGCEPDEEAAKFARKFLANALLFGWVCGEPFEQAIAFTFPCDNSFDIILAAHVLEHMVDPFMVLRRIYGRLKPGGRVIIIVPDATDPVNPDHLWFFTEETLRASMEAAGFIGEIKMCVRKRIERENFIYATAVKI